jgi:hypothetical protein
MKRLQLTWVLFASLLFIVACSAYQENQPTQKATPPVYETAEEKNPDPETYDCAQLTVVQTLGDPSRNEDIKEGDALFIEASKGVYVSTTCEYTMLGYEWTDEPKYEKVPTKGSFLYIEPYLYETADLTITVRSTKSKAQDDAQKATATEQARTCVYPQINTQTFVKPFPYEMIIVKFSEEFATGNPNDEFGNHLMVFGTTFTPQYEAIVYGDTDGVYIDQAIQICRMPATEEVLAQGAPYLVIDGFYFGWLKSYVLEDSINEMPTMRIQDKLPEAEQLP